MTSQPDSKDIPRKEEFQKYLEKAGVIDQLTKLLVSLYENPDRPENALVYIKSFLGADVPSNVRHTNHTSHMICISIFCIFCKKKEINKNSCMCLFLNNM